MEDFLLQYKLQHLTKTFRDNNITLDIILNLLTDDDVEQLAPKIGDRIKLKSAISDALLKETPSPTIPSTPLTELQEESHQVQDDIFKDEDEPSVVDNKELLVVVADPVYEENNLSSHATPSTITNNSSFMLLPTNPLPSVLSLLISTAFGRAIIERYTKGNNLDEKHRDIVTDIIITRLLDADLKLDNDKLSNLADQVLEIFPSENKYIWYVAPVSKRHSKRNQPEPARGKLVDKHRNKLTALRKITAESFRSRDRGHNSHSAPQTDSETSETCWTSENKAEPEAVNSKCWLRTSWEPEEEVIFHWNQSQSLRDIKHADIGQFLDEWPILTTKWAPQLINIDFQHKFDFNEDFDINWTFSSFFESLLQLRKTHITNPYDKSLVEILHTEDMTTNSQNAIKLHLLASLVPPRAFTRIGKKHWKPSMAESRNGIFLHTNSPSTLPGIIEERIHFYSERSLTAQPYIVLLGSAIDNISGTFVVIHGNLYKTDSVLDALDFCFKAYQVMDAKYTFESNHLWLLIHMHVYKLNADDIPIPSSISNIQI